MLRITHVCLQFVFMLSFLRCGNSKKQDSSTNETGIGTQIVNRSIEHHGGYDKYNKLQSIQFTKQTILFDSSGKEESNIVQRNSFQLHPDIEGTIQWVENGDSIKIEYANSQAVKYVNNIEEKESSESAKNSILASLYVLLQPFKLLDEGTGHEYMGEDSIDGTAVNKVALVYDGAKEGDDEWAYFFKVENDEFVANMVDHKGRRSFIQNLSFDSSTPLKLHQHRKSYFVDSLRTILYLRAEYFYGDYQLDFQQP